MAKSKEAKATPKKSKDVVAKKKTKSDKPSKSAKSKPSNLSEEQVVDSDSDNEQYYTPETKSTAKGKATAATSERPKTKPDSSESEDSSDEEESEEVKQKPIAAPQKPETVPAKVNGVKRKVEESDSPDGESSSEEESEEEQLEPKKAKTSHESSSSSSEEEGSSGSEKESATKPGAVNGRESQVQSSIKSIPVTPFEPPKGYRALDTSESQASSSFPTSSLAGKQIWHITAPSNVPVKRITEVALSSIQNADPVLHHKGHDYILAREKNYGTALDRVLVPDSTGYSHADQKVDEHFIIQQKLELPDFRKIQGTGSKAAADIATAPVSTIRPQPHGLKMRYKPPGFGKGDPGLIGSESDSEAVSSKEKGKAAQFPKTLGVHGVAVDSEAQATERKKDKKKKRQSEDVQMMDVDQPVVNGASSMPPPSSTTPRKKDEKRKEKSETPERPGTTSSRKSSESAASLEKTKKTSKDDGKVKESEEEKVKRKEAKRLKKAKVNGA